MGLRHFEITLMLLKDSLYLMDKSHVRLIKPVHIH